MRLRLIAVLSVLTAPARAAATGPGSAPTAGPLRVAWLVPPTRRADGNALRARAERLAALLAARWGTSLARAEPLADLPARLARAKALALSDFDEAASAYDGALDDGARSPRRIADPAEFVDAHLRRVAVALARNESERAEALLARVRRYDPTLELSEGERSPQMRRLFARLVASQGATPALAPYDLSLADDEADVLVVLRALPDGGVELLRYDGQRLVLRAALPGSASDLACIGELAAVPAPRRAEIVVAPRGLDRSKVVGGILSAVGGLGLAAAGSYYAATAASRRSSLSDGCSAATPCPGEELDRRAGDYQTSTALASVFTAVGGVALIAGAVLIYYGTHRRWERASGR
jgi:hypothetical protein